MMHFQKQLAQWAQFYACSVSPPLYRNILHSSYPFWQCSQCDLKKKWLDLRNPLNDQLTENAIYSWEGSCFQQAFIMFSPEWSAACTEAVMSWPEWTVQDITWLIVSMYHLGKCLSEKKSLLILRYIRINWEKKTLDAFARFSGRAPWLSWILGITWWGQKGHFRTFWFDHISGIRPMFPLITKCDRKEIDWILQW